MRQTLEKRMYVEEMRRQAPGPIRKRMQEIETLESYRKHFKVCVPNNYALMLVKAEYRLEAYLEEVATYTSFMNRANSQMQVFCSGLATSLPEDGESSLAALLEEWRLTIEKRNNFLGVFYAERVVEALAKRDCDVRHWLRHGNSGVGGQFLDVPARVKNILRVNLCIPHEAVIHYLDEFMRRVFLIPEAFSMVERVEVAKPLLEGEGVVDYPTIIFYLVESADDLAHYGEVDHLLRLLQPILVGLPTSCVADTLFADVWYPFATVTQGFKLWKRYLNLLGILDCIYDRDFNYAYLRSDLDKVGLSEASRNFPRILSQYRPNCEGVFR